MTAIDMFRWHFTTPIGFPSVREFRKNYLDELIFTDPYGMKFPMFSLHYTDRNIKGARPAFYNNTARDFIVRMINNWMGDDGMITKIKWVFPQLYKEMRIDKDGREFLEKVPFMRGRGCERHGFVGDTIISKGYVTGKYNKGGKCLVDIACWGETLDGEVVTIVPVTISLPSKSHKNT